jgi:hypothetical protein
MLNRQARKIDAEGADTVSGILLNEDVNFSGEWIGQDSNL